MVLSTQASSACAETCDCAKRTDWGAVGDYPRAEQIALGQLWEAERTV